MRTSARRVALLAFDEMELLDVSGVLQPLTVAGRHWNWRPFAITVFAKNPGLVETRNQVRLEATAGLATEHETELLIVPGGYGARRAAEDDETVGFVARHGATATRIVAIGAGVFPLARAGLLDDVEVATTRDLVEPLTELAPRARPNTDAKVVDSDKVLTVATSALSVAVGLEVVAKELGPKLAVQVADALGHHWGADNGERQRLSVSIIEPIP